MLNRAGKSTIKCHVILLQVATVPVTQQVIVEVVRLSSRYVAQAALENLELGQRSASYDVHGDGICWYGRRIWDCRHRRDGGTAEVLVTNGAVRVVRVVDAAGATKAARQEDAVEAEGAVGGGRRSRGGGNSRDGRRSRG